MRQARSMLARALVARQRGHHTTLASRGADHALSPYVRMLECITMRTYLRNMVACYQGRFIGVVSSFPSTASAVPMSPVNAPSVDAHRTRGRAYMPGPLGAQYSPDLLASRPSVQSMRLFAASSGVTATGPRQFFLVETTTLITNESAYLRQHPNTCRSRRSWSSRFA